MEVVNRPKNVVNEMRYKTLNSLQAQLVSRDGTRIASQTVLRKLDGLACHSDSVLNYSELDFVAECSLRGGHPRVVLDELGHLTMTVEVDSLRRLTRKELSALREDFEGQLTDGLGTGCFDELTTATGLAVELKFPLKSKCVQTEGTAWQPKASTSKGNKQRVSAAAKIVEKICSAPSKQRASSKSAARGTRSAKPANIPARANLDKLLRLLEKPNRDQLFDQIKIELEANGNDLSQLVDGTYPYGNFNDPKLLRLLLNAGLPPETTDVKGNSLLIQAAANPQCLQLLLTENVNVNRICNGYYASTALIRASALGNRKSVELLLEHGADPTIKDKSGKTAQELVARHSRERQVIIELLR
jgi:hypothetical protein